jgi:serine protease Do
MESPGMNRIRLVLITGLVLGLLSGVALTATFQDHTGAQDAATSGPERTLEDSARVVQQVANEVVTVYNEQNNGSGSSAEPVGSGTGFIISEDGFIVTNWHVVTGADDFLVVFSNGDRRSATLIGSDQLSDLAVIKVDGDVPAVVTFGDSDQLLPGETVLAIGSPLGSFTNTVTKGIVSAVGRDLEQSNYNNLIQHDAAINPGNSGGPLFNLKGEVIGVNTLGIPQENGQVVQGIFFALPSNSAQSITQRLIEDGQVTYPFFGITYQTVTWQNSAYFQLNVEHGVLVTQVTPGGPADEAEIVPGDVVLSLDGTSIDESNSFSEVLFSSQPGDTVEALVLRDGQELTIPVTLVDRNQGQ